MFDDDDGFEIATAVGTGYALYRYGQDRQTEELARQTQQLADAIRAGSDGSLVHDIPDQDEPIEPAPNALDFVTEDLPESFEDFIGQEPLKVQVMVAAESAKIRNAPFPHTLFASGYPGVGKTTIARLISVIMGSRIIELVPPFKIQTLVAAAQQLGDHDILFVDELHKLTDGIGARGAEILLKILEDRVAFLPTGEVVQLAQITVIGATTDRDKLPETVVDRFKLKPYFQAYTQLELVEIAIKFAYAHDAENYVSNVLAGTISLACRGIPRIEEEMVMAIRDLTLAMGSPPTPAELLEFLEVEPDGLTRMHAHYLTALRQFFARETKDGTWEYIVGEAAMMQILRETKQGIGRIERFLVERGLIDRTPRGRRLTALGIARAEELIAAGKGAHAA